MEDHDSPEQRAEMLRRWAASGAMALTGVAERPPLGPPAGLVPGLDRLARPFPGLDPLALLAERAAVAGLSRRGAISCGGATRLMRAADGWFAVSLPRPEDAELVPAWLAFDGPPAPSGSERRTAGADRPGEPPWHVVAPAVQGRSIAELEDRGAMLGLAMSGLGSAPTRDPVLHTSFGPGPGPRPVEHAPVVVDLSALWAGPLCGALLADSGARVVKVESSARPDGARGGPQAFFDRLNSSKASVVMDLDDRDGVALLRTLIEQADVVIESSRPRALQQMGIDAEAILSDPTTRPRVWVSITAHGRQGEPGRIGFGDDAAVAGALVVDDGSAPVFCADAIADPCTGLAAAGACLDALTAGGRWLLDVALSAVAASLTGPTVHAPPGLVAAPPAPPPPPPGSPPPPAGSPPLGADTAEVLARLQDGRGLSGP